MHHIAYLVDGPNHGMHIELPGPEPEWRVVRPMTNLRHFTTGRFQGDPELVVTGEFGVYKRENEPQMYTTHVAVWRYHWRGWQ